MKTKLCTFLLAFTFGSLQAVAQLNSPQGVIFDGQGNLWVANSASNQVLELNPTNGTVLATITASLDNPVRLAFDGAGNLYVANANGNSITVYDSNLKQLTQKTLHNRLNFPTGVVVDAYGDVFVSNNQSNNIEVFSIDGGRSETLTKDNFAFPFTAPGALAVRGTNLYVSLGPTVGENAVISYNVGEFLGNNPKERVVYTDHTNTGPSGIAFDSAGNIYVADFYSETWVKFNAQGKLLLVVHDGIAQPEGIAVDANGNVYVANASLNNITVYNPAGQLINTLH